MNNTTLCICGVYTLPDTQSEPYCIFILKGVHSGKNILLYRRKSLFSYYAMVTTRTEKTSKFFKNLFIFFFKFYPNMTFKGTHFYRYSLIYRYSPKNLNNLGIFIRSVDHGFPSSGLQSFNNNRRCFGSTRIMKMRTIMKNTGWIDQSVRECNNLFNRM